MQETVSAFTSIASGQEVNTRLDEQIRRTLSLEKYQLHTLTADMELGAPILLSLNLDGVDVELTLSPASVRTPGFQIFTYAEAGVSIPHSLPPETTYRGRIVQWPDSLAAASLIDGQLTAFIVRDDNSWSLQPLTDVDPDADPDVYVS